MLFVLLISPSYSPSVSAVYSFSSTSYDCNYSSTGTRSSFISYYYFIIDYCYCNSSELYTIFFVNCVFSLLQHDYNTIDIQFRRCWWHGRYIYVCNNPRFLYTKGLRDELITNWSQNVHAWGKRELKFLWCLIANLNLFSMCLVECVCHAQKRGILRSDFNSEIY